MTAYFPTASNIAFGNVFVSEAAGDSVTFFQPYNFASIGSEAVLISHSSVVVTNMTSLYSGTSYGIQVLNTEVSNVRIINNQTGTIGSLSDSDGTAAVAFVGTNVSLQNRGTILSAHGIGVQEQGTWSVIENGGTIQANAAGIAATGVNYAITNSGLITTGGGAAAIGVHMSGSGNLRSLFNSGTIQTTSAQAGYAVQVDGTDPATIINTGSIRSAGGAAIHADSPGVALVLYNSGVISGSLSSSYSIVGSDLSDTIVNSGHINRAIYLGGGGDIFDGIGGSVGGIVFGGAGNDIYRISDALALVFESADPGSTDTVETTVSFSLVSTGEVENLTLLGTARNGTGNEFNNLISGNDEHNFLSGLGGHDTLFGNAGDDSLRGDIGEDLVNGGDGNDTLRGGAAVDSLYGGEGDDEIWGDVAGDRLFGDNGEDVLVGGAGRDTLYGGADADSFVFRVIADSGVGSTLRDVISGFEAGLDVIDLARIDANTAVNGNQAFAWIGTAAFGSIAGQLRLVIGASSVLQADVNGDGLADFELQFNAIATISVNDILL